MEAGRSGPTLFVYLCILPCADNAAGDDVAGSEEEPHRDCGFIREEPQTLHEFVE